MKNGAHLPKLKNTKNQLERRRSTVELHPLKFEFVQNEGIKAPKVFKFFFSQRPISYGIGFG